MLPPCKRFPGQSSRGGCFPAGVRAQGCTESDASGSAASSSCAVLPGSRRPPQWRNAGCSPCNGLRPPQRSTIPQCSKQWQTSWQVALHQMSCTFWILGGFSMRVVENRVPCKKNCMELAEQHAHVPISSRLTRMQSCQDHCLLQQLAAAHTAITVLSVQGSVSSSPCAW